MGDSQKLQTSEINGRLWSTRARDWADIQEGVHRPIYEAVFTRTGIGGSTRYLETGCGAGMAAQMAAALGADVSGIDAAAALLEIARTRVPGADFRQGDLEKLPFADGAFDMVTGFNSFQYAGNPGAALAEARRVTRPGGAVVIATWGDPEGMEAAALVGALRHLMPPPPPGTPGPFALSDESTLREFAANSGLEPVELFDVDCDMVYPDEATAVRGMNSSGNAARAMESLDEQVVTDAYAKAFAPFLQADGTVRAKATFRCLLARH